jgi:hypothetical protein
VREFSEIHYIVLLDSLKERCKEKVPTGHSITHESAIITTDDYKVIIADFPTSPMLKFFACTIFVNLVCYLHPVKYVSTMPYYFSKLMNSESLTDTLFFLLRVCLNTHTNRVLPDCFCRGFVVLNFERYNRLFSS